MKGNGHFWPAYVDMMTVLLLVYLLISMIFQVLLIVAQQNVGIKLSEQRQVEIRSISQEPEHLREASSPRYWQIWLWMDWKNS